MGIWKYIKDWFPFYIYEDCKYAYNYRKGRRSDYELLCDILKYAEFQMKRGVSTKDIFLEIMQFGRVLHIHGSKRRIDVLVGNWHGFVIRKRRKYRQLIAYNQNISVFFDLI